MSLSPSALLARLTSAHDPRRASNSTASRTSGDEQGGQALVEFALVAMLLLSLLAGVFELGRALHASILVSQAAREGARVAMVDTDDADVSTAAQDAGKPLGGLVILVARANGEATVTVTYRVNILFPLMSIVLGKNYLDVRSTMTSRAP